MSISKFIVLSFLLFASMLTGPVIGVPIILETVPGTVPGKTDFTEIDVSGVRYPGTDNGQRHANRILMMGNVKESRSQRVVKSVTVVYNPRNRQNIPSHSCTGRDRLTSCSHNGNSSAKEEAVVITDRAIDPPADVEPREVKETPAWMKGVMMGVVVLSGIITTVVVSFQAYRLFREESFEEDEEEQADIAPPPVVQLASDHIESLYPRSDSLETIDLNDDPINDTSSPPSWYNRRG